ncbi:MAG: diaminopimelate decarboxylase, partial [Burkholderiales bacterium]
MDFAYRNGALCAEQVPLEDIARRFGTPCFVYSRAAIERQYGAYAQAFADRKSLVAYSVKANSNLAILALMARLGAGFDIVSGGELARVLAAGGDPRKVLFSGIGKTEEEIEQALRAGILCLNVESEAELERVDAVAARIGTRAPIALRINPDIDAKTHPHVSTGLRQSKFGVPYAEADRLYREAARRAHLEPVGIGCHIGSLLADPAPWIAAAERVVELADRIERAGIALAHIDVGGGIGIRYRDEPQRSIDGFLGGALRALGARDKTLIVDPGRSIVGNAGVLLTRVQYV